MNKRIQTLLLAAVALSVQTAFADEPKEIGKILDGTEKRDGVTEHKVPKTDVLEQKLEGSDGPAAERAKKRLEMHAEHMENREAAIEGRPNAVEQPTPVNSGKEIREEMHKNH